MGRLNNASAPRMPWGLRENCPATAEAQHSTEQNLQRFMGLHHPVATWVRSLMEQPRCLLIPAVAGLASGPELLPPGTTPNQALSQVDHKCFGSLSPAGRRQGRTPPAVAACDANLLFHCVPRHVGPPV